MIAFPPIFVAETKIVFQNNFVAPLIPIARGRL